jgi:hypothetical protein
LHDPLFPSYTLSHPTHSSPPLHLFLFSLFQYLDDGQRGLLNFLASATYVRNNQAKNILPLSCFGFVIVYNTQDAKRNDVMLLLSLLLSVVCVLSIVALTVSTHISIILNIIAIPSFSSYLPIPSFLHSFLPFIPHILPPSTPSLLPSRFVPILLSLQLSSPYNSSPSLPLPLFHSHHLDRTS